MKKNLLYLIILIYPIFGFSQNVEFESKLIKEIGFTENKGQFDINREDSNNNILFYYNAPGLSVFFKKNEWSYVLNKHEATNEKNELLSSINLLDKGGKDKFKNFTIHSHRIDIRLVNTFKNSKIVKEKQSVSYENFYTNQTPKDEILKAYNYKKITYKNIWKNIDIEWVAEGSKLKYNIILHPGANPEEIQLAYQGADELNLIENNIQTSVSFNTLKGLEKSTLTESIPEVFGADDASFTLNENTVGFTMENWDKNRVAIIDPQLVWGTYYGDKDQDDGYEVAVDKNGNVYLMGITQWVSFARPDTILATNGAHQRSHSAGSCPFLAKFNSNGVRQWGTYFGNNQTLVSALSVDSVGNIYFGGVTLQTSNIATSGAHQTIKSDREDAFFTKFNTNGARLWGTYYGGDGGDVCNGIALDNFGNVFFSGVTTSTRNIATNGSHQDSLYKYEDAFITKFDTSGARKWGTYYGGEGKELNNYVAIDKFGNVFLSGTTNSAINIATSGASKDTINLKDDVFLAKFNTNGVLQWGTYYGGDEVDQPNGLATDIWGSVIITGKTLSSENIASVGAHQDSILSYYSGFLVKFDSFGKNLWGTYLTSDVILTSNGVSVDFAGNIYVTGSTGFVKNNSKFTNPSAHLSIHTGGYKVYILKFKLDGTHTWGTYYGSGGGVEGNSIVVDNSANVFITGNTYSNSNISTLAAHQISHAGDPFGNSNSSFYKDAFLAKFKFPFVDIKSDFVSNQVANSYCQNDSFQPIIQITNHSSKEVNNFYYKFLLTGNDTLIDSVFVDTMYKNTSRIITLQKYFKLNSSGKVLLKTYPIYYQDENPFNDTLVFPITVYSHSFGGNTVGSKTVCYNSNYGSIPVINNIGKVVDWQSSINGINWINLDNNSPIQFYEDLKITTQYRAIVKNNDCDFDTSTIVTITVAPQSEGGISIGENTVCSASNFGSIDLVEHVGQVIKWQSSTNEGISWTDIDDTTSSLTYENLTDTTLFRAIVKSDVCDTDISTSTTISVVPKSYGGTTIGSDTVCFGVNSGKINLVDFVGKISKWQLSTNEGITWIDINDTSNSLTYENLERTTQYRAIVKNNICEADTSSVAIILVVPKSLGGITIGGDSVCLGSNAGVITVSGHTGVIIKWQTSTNDGISWTDIENSATSLAYENLERTTLYRAIIKNDICEADTSSVTIISTVSESYGGITIGSDSVCSGSNDGIIKLVNHIGKVIKWQSSSNEGVTWVDINNTTTSITYQNLKNTTLYRAVIKNNTCEADTSSVTIISTLSESYGGITIGSDSVCSGSNDGIIKLVNHIGKVIKWQSSSNEGVTWVDINNTATSITYQNLKNTTLYRAVIKNNTCEADTSSNTNIIVLPITYGGETSINKILTTSINDFVVRLSNFDGEIVKWQSNDFSDTTWTDIENKSDSLVIFKLNKTTQYRVVVKNKYCNESYSSISIVYVDTSSVILYNPCQTDLNIFPNPIKPSQLLNIKSDHGKVLKINSVHIVSLEGKLITILPILNIANGVAVVIPYFIRPSTYLLRINSDANVCTFKIKVVN
jgi:uncharacterized protein YjbI with pentapeptide repeats